jgi:hypothetical protein
MPKAHADLLHDEYTAAAQYKRVAVAAGWDFMEPTGLEGSAGDEWPSGIVLVYPRTADEGNEEGASQQHQNWFLASSRGSVYQWRAQNWKCDLSQFLSELHQLSCLYWLGGREPVGAGLASGAEYVLGAETARREVTPVAVRSIDPVVESEFPRLAETWRRETAHLSSITQKSIHAAYQRIIGLGPRAVPLILSELEQRPDHWFWALRAITGEDPVVPDDRGDVRRMTAAWLSLGRRRGWI